MDANTTLMKSIRAHWGDAIVLACAASSVPPSFLAALIANESGGTQVLTPNTPSRPPTISPIQN
jgi:hypothetical protein